MEWPPFKFQLQILGTLNPYKYKTDQINKLKFNEISNIIILLKQANILCFNLLFTFNTIIINVIYIVICNTYAFFIGTL